MPARSRVLGLASELGPIVGAENVLTESSALEAFRKDMADFEATPAVVARPSTEEQVGRILDVATRRRVPVVARGAGTSLTGAVVLDGAIILDMQRFNRILKIDPVNWYVQVQAGVVLDDLNQALRRRDSSSRRIRRAASCARSAARSRRAPAACDVCDTERCGIGSWPSASCSRTDGA